MPLIDAHVHFYTAQDLYRVAGQLPYAKPTPHPLTPWLEQLVSTGRKPSLINNVHLSILPDSGNVFASFDELAALQRRDAQRYAGIAIIGTILANPRYATAERLAHPQVRGIRIVLHDAKPASISKDAYATPEWQSLFARLRPDQHVHVYAQEPEVNRIVLNRIPPGIPVAIDHLGTCRPERGSDDPAYVALLAAAKARGGVIFKGPGYRTATEPEAVLPFVVRILHTLGPEALLLQASDAPHVGSDQNGNPYAEIFTPGSAFDFTTRLAGLAAQQFSCTAQTLLNAAAARIFHPQTGA